MFLAKLERLLLFLTILLLPTQLGRHFWPDFSYIYSLKIDYLSPTVYFWNILSLFLFLVWILQRKKINKLALNLFLIFIFSQVLSLIQAVNVGAGLVRLAEYLVVGFLGLYLASQDFNSVKKTIFKPLLISLILESALGIAEVVSKSSLELWILGERSFNINTPAIAKFSVNGVELLRPYATFPHPNVLAGFLTIGIILVFIFESKFKNIFIPIILIGIISTFSRTAILAGVVSLVFLIQRKFIFWLFLFLLILSPLLYIRFYSIFNFDSLSFVRREELIETSLQLFWSNPLFGVGLNNFIPSLATNLISGPNRFLQPVHNIFLLTLSETGIIGAIGVIGLIGYPILRLLKLPTILLTWGIILFLGLFDHYFLTLPQGYRLLFLVWGLTLSAVSSKIDLNAKTS